MLPITDFLSCIDPLDEFDSLSYHQKQHAKTYVTGLAAELPGAGSFYDHSEGEPVWEQDFVYVFYIDHKTSYRLAFRRVEGDDAENQGDEEKKIRSRTRIDYRA